MVQEVIKHLRKSEKGFNLDVFKNYIRQKLIQPLIYLDSRLVFACEYNSDDCAVAVGCCYLSGYLNLDEEIITICDLVLSDSQPSLSLRRLIKKDWFIEDPRINGWNYNEKLLEKALDEGGMINPKPFTKNLELKCFISMNQSNILTINNIIITQGDFNFLENQINYQGYESALDKPKLLSDENLKSLKTGEKIRLKQKEFSKKAVKEIKLKAEKKWNFFDSMIHSFIKKTPESTDVFIARRIIKKCHSKKDEIKIPPDIDIPAESSLRKRIRIIRDQY